MSIFYLSTVFVDTLHFSPRAPNLSTLLVQTTTAPTYQVDNPHTSLLPAFPFAHHSPSRSRIAGPGAKHTNKTHIKKRYGLGMARRQKGLGIRFPSQWPLAPQRGAEERAGAFCRMRQHREVVVHGRAGRRSGKGAMRRYAYL